MMPRFSVSPALSKAMLDGHSLIGVIFGALIYLLCVSGTVSVLADEFALWEAPAAPVVKSASPELLAKVGAAGFVKAKAEGVAHDLFVFAPSPELPRLSVMAFDGAKRREWLADAQGNLLPAAKAPWTEFMRQHHHNFNLPAPFGAYLVGIIGTLLLASLFSGVIAHRRILKDAFRLRLGGSKRLASADLHNRIGVWALPFHLIVSLTGSLLGLAGLIIGLLALVAYNGDQEKAIGALLGPQPTEDSRPAPLPDIVPMVAQVAQRTPGATISSVQYGHVGTVGQTVSLTTAEPGHLAQNEGWTFSGNGRFLAKAGFTDGTVGMRIYGMLTPLHFGTYGGIALKLIYVVLGTGLCVIVATGVTIWLARKRDQGRAAPRWERVWSALVWGQAPAFALSALVAIPRIADPLPVFWIAFILPLILAALVPVSPVMISRWAHYIGGATLLMVALSHVGVRGTTSGVGILIDAALIAGALLYLRLGLKRIDTVAQTRTISTGKTVAAEGI